MKHTAGKWEYDTSGNYYHASGVIRMNGVLIAKMVTQTTHKPGEVDANARLIAAAPELLEACRLALPFLEEYRERVIKGEITGKLLTGDYAPVNDMRRAIAKAEGVKL